MMVVKDTVVSIDYELRDLRGNLLEKSGESYLHGDYDSIFPAVEAALEGRNVGDQVQVTLQPEEAFGDYDSELVYVEPRAKFPVPDLKVGMQFEGSADNSDDVLIFTVTDVAEDKVVVDGNHPLAGQALAFSCTVTEVRAATPEELEHGHAHGEHGHHHDDDHDHDHDHGH